MRIDDKMMCMSRIQATVFLQCRAIILFQVKNYIIYVALSTQLRPSSSDQATSSPDQAALTIAALSSNGVALAEQRAALAIETALSRNGVALAEQQTAPT